METLTNKREHGGHKQTLTTKRQRRSDSPPAAGLQWLILNSSIDDDGSDFSAADASTTAACCTSSGKPFSISFGIAAPPALCSLHFDWLAGGDSDVKVKHPKPEAQDVSVIAGHDDVILIKMRMPRPEVRRGVRQTATLNDYFLYEAGGGDRPPSLSLLPACNVPVQVGYKNHSDPTPKFRHLGIQDTGILRRRGEEDDDLLVCQYQMTCDPPIYDMADLCMLHIGRGQEWIVRRVPIVEQREGSSELRRWRWHHRDIVADAVVAVGNRFLCWVDYGKGFILCDMAEEEISKLRYVPLPATYRHDGCGHYPLEMQAYCTLGAAGPDSVRFVRVSPPGCRRGNYPGRTLCEGSSSSFSVTTWTTTLSLEGVKTWVKDIVLDCNEIWKWQLTHYGCLPRDKHLEYPMVSSDDPDVIFFKVEGMAVAINMTSKKLVSIVPSGGTIYQDEHTQIGRVVSKICW